MINCTIEYKNIPHLNQLYTGFKLLADANVINLKFSNEIVHEELKHKPVIRAIINNETIVYYDTLDGFNWINKDNASDNLKYFFQTFKCDYYFKRSFNEALEKENADFKIKPLGLYYNITPYFNIQKLSLLSLAKKKFKNSTFLRRLMKVNANFYLEDFQNYPNIEIDDVKILFSAGLWNPEEAKSAESKLQRQEINNFRIEIVKRLKKEFGSNFIGGISKNNYSLSILEEEFLLPFDFTNRQYYLNTMKKSIICIATTGLFDSIGGKLAEYVCASRAIITEPLNYEVSGIFKEKENYLEFRTVDELINNINYLLENKNKIRDMMFNNYKYYNTHLRPDILVYNTLDIILNNRN